MSVQAFNTISGYRTRGGFWPTRGLPTIDEAMTHHREFVIRKGDAFVAREEGMIANVVDIPGGGFSIGDRIVFFGTDVTAASSWRWVGPSEPIPANPSDPAKKVLTVVLSEDDNNY